MMLADAAKPAPTQRSFAKIKTDYLYFTQRLIVYYKCDEHITTVILHVEVCQHLLVIAFQSTHPAYNSLLATPDQIK